MQKTPESPDFIQSDTMPDIETLRRELEIITPAIEASHPGFRRVQRLADLMDSRFKVPGTPIRLGLDAIIGLIPGIGDTVNLGIAAYIVLEAIRLGARKRDIVHMLFNIGLDWLIGLIPLIGDLFDVGWRGNMRNIAILEKRLNKL